MKCKSTWTLCYFIKNKDNKQLNYDCIFNKPSEDVLTQECSLNPQCNLRESYIIHSNECYPQIMRRIRTYNAMKRRLQ